MTSRSLATLLLALLASPAWAGEVNSPAQIPSFPPVCTLTQVPIPSVGAYGEISNLFTTQAPSGTQGRLNCVKFVMPCTPQVPFTKLAFEIVTGVADSWGAFAIYAESGSLKLMDTGAKRTSAALNCTASGVPEACCTGVGTGSCNVRSATGLPPTTLVAGRIYLGCYATSATSTQTRRGVTSAGYGLLGQWTTYGILGGTTDAEKGQWNEACTAASTPYACCSGSGTGSCAGMPATVAGTASAVEAQTLFVLGS